MEQEISTTELLQSVRKIEIKSRGLSQNIFAGQYHSAFKGHGMAFSEVREYQVGDDVRDIDWNVTARFNHPYVKVFEEERELTMMILIDVSGSLDFGTLGNTKKRMAAEIAATLAFSALLNNDKVGVIFFSDVIEKYIPPKKGRKHVLFIIREILSFRPISSRTNLFEPIEFLTKVMKRRCTACILSDFNYNLAGNHLSKVEHALMIASQRHDIMAVQIYDPRAKELPNIGLMKVRDAETGYELVIDTSSARLRKEHAAYWHERQKQLKQLFAKTGTDWGMVATNGDFVRPLMGIFAKRSA